MARKNYYAERTIGHVSLARTEPVAQHQQNLASTTPNRLDRWSGLLAAWAQVATLGVVIFGYFYTVVPVFQRDRLEEEVAKLEIQREQIESEARQSIEKSELLRQSIAGLHQEQAKLSEANKTLLSELQQLTSARREAVESREDALSPDKGAKSHHEIRRHLSEGNRP